MMTGNIIGVKTREELESMREAGRKLAGVLARVLDEVRAGVQLVELDELADTLISKEGGEACFKKVNDYGHATCLNVNEGVVHGLPNGRCLKKGDILSIDIGLKWKGFNADMARTVIVGQRGWIIDKSELQREFGQDKRMDARLSFVLTGRRAFDEAVSVVKEGNYIGNISEAIQRTVEAGGYNVSRNLTGHGIGRGLHEAPMIPCLLTTEVTNTPVLRPNMTLAIEVIYMNGSWALRKLVDGWTLLTQDGSIAGLWENTIVVTNKGAEVLTKNPLLCC